MPKKMLVVYFSWSNGNTARVAQALAGACDADLERIQTLEAYPDDYDTVVSQARREVEQGFLPELQPLEHDPTGYDIVAVGTPTWWYTMAPAISSFFSMANLSGKLVVPFTTNAGWPGSVIEDMEEAASGATPVESMEVRFASDGGPRMMTDEAEVRQWMGRVAALAK